MRSLEFNPKKQKLTSAFYEKNLQYLEREKQQRELNMKSKLDQRQHVKDYMKQVH